MEIKPILFSTPMVEAILNRRKTQTRRTCKIQPKEWQTYTNYKDGTFNINGPDYDSNDIQPKYQIGDILWVRETFHKYITGKNNSAYDEGQIIYSFRANNKLTEKAKIWKPSIFMPKEACRLFLECTDVRVERILDITEKDAIAEGVEKYFDTGFYVMYGSKNDWAATAYASFAYLWETINGKASFNANRWVWVYDFKIVDRPNNFLNQ